MELTLKIGLVRHYKVKQDYPKGAFICGRDVNAWFQTYDLADIEAGRTDLKGIEWSRCYSSSLSLAVKTAELIFQGPITQMAELKEIAPPALPARLRLPFLLWAILIRRGFNGPKFKIASNGALYLFERQQPES
nr:hypothetical protein [Brevibacillus agri]